MEVTGQDNAVGGTRWRAAILGWPLRNGRARANRRGLGWPDNVPPPTGSSGLPPLPATPQEDSPAPLDNPPPPTGSFGESPAPSGQHDEPSPATGSADDSPMATGAQAGSPESSAALGDPTRPNGRTDPPSSADVSRETVRAASRARRWELAAAIPEGDVDTPLARSVADNARKRITLTGMTFAAPPRTRVLTVANQKGGVGKTTTAVNIGAALAQGGLRVLIVDLDPQGNASTALGIDHHTEIPSVYDALVEDTDLAEVVVGCPTVPGLLCAPSTIDLAGAEIELVAMVARETRLRRALATYLESNPVDYVLIDCPPSLGLLTVNAFVAADEVFIPIQCEYYALEGLSQLLRNIELIRSHLNPGLLVSTILLTMHDARTRLSAQVADEVRSHFPSQVLRAAIPRAVRVSEAPSFGQTVMTYDPSSPGALSYLEAAAELAVRGASAMVGTASSGREASRP